ncbi:hypothetical protein GF324_01390 [bacterium]|nr:hypothetical protein [bacterium]
MFKKILYPSDCSDMSNAGFPVAVDLAKKYDTSITILNVHDEFMSHEEMQMLRVSEMSYEEKMKEIAEKSRRVLANMIQESDIEDRCEIVLREGKPKQQIVNFARENGYDLIVMTSNGRSNLQEQLMGSTAEYVVHHSKVHVLVVKEAS